MPAFLDNAEPRPWYAGGDFLVHRNRRSLILPATNNQGRHGDSGQQRAVVRPCHDSFLLTDEGVLAGAGGHVHDRFCQSLVVQPAGMQKRRQQTRRHPVEPALLGQFQQRQPLGDTGRGFGAG